MVDKREQPTSNSQPITTPNFVPLETVTELWTSKLRPCGETGPRCFYQTSCIHYKLLNNLTSQQSPSRNINDLNLDDMAKFMKGQFNPVRYIVCKCFKFWSAVDHKPGKTIHDIATQIHHDTVTRNFPLKHDPHNSARNRHLEAVCVCV